MVTVYCMAEFWARSCPRTVDEFDEEWFDKLPTRPCSIQNVCVVTHLLEISILFQEFFQYIVRQLNDCFTEFYLSVASR